MLCADASRVSGAEIRQACGVLHRLVALGKTAPSEILREGWTSAWSGELASIQDIFACDSWVFSDRSRVIAAPGGYVAVGLARPVVEYTRDDIVVEACVAGAGVYPWCPGLPKMCAAQGVDELTNVMGWVQSCPYEAQNAGPDSDERNTQMVLRLLEICRDPHGLTLAEITAAWSFIYYHSSQRPAVHGAMIRAGLYGVALAALKAVGEPDDWLRWQHPGGTLAGMVSTIVCHTCMSNPP
jgi:hypothetical protein